MPLPSPLRPPVLLAVLVLALLAPSGQAEVTPEDFVVLVAGPADEVDARLEKIEAGWSPSFVPMVLEVLQLSNDPHASRRLLEIQREKTGKGFGGRIDPWFEWLWSNEARRAAPRYAEFKSLLYRLIDPRFAAYFSSDRASSIRLDEVRWGGVVQDGIPPLRDPRMVGAEEADYLGPRNIVFGIEVNGDARAYPNRILAWHEMFTDTVGGVPVAGVYCTLCGTVILYETSVGGVEHRLGTSGFLYRSNKLMYDAATQSLWNTLWGTPVIGPLVDQGIELPRRSVVTTTWKEWVRRHPDTQVLALDTGHIRDYSEGAAYREYFATDELMFTVPSLDRRLDNKAEVLALLPPDAREQPLAIAVRFLAKNPIHHEELGGTEIVVLTDRSGASRVYETGGRRFQSWDGLQTVVDEGGVPWTLSEGSLRSSGGDKLQRVVSHRAFWFGWYSAYETTRLVR